MSELPYKTYSTYPGWRDATAKSVGHAKRRRENPDYRSLQNKRSELEEKRKRLDARIAEITKEIVESCPHLVEHHVIRYDGREDDYGSYVRGMDFELRCERCGKILEKWSRED